jgi:hypothetical protein
MNEAATTVEEYDGQLADWVAAFAAGHYQDFEGALESTSTPHDVKRFLINSFGNRYTWLMREGASLARVFDDFPALVKTYVLTVPQAPYDISGAGDEEHFLIWLTQTQTLTPVQRDFVTCQRGEYAVATEARRNRPAHVRFQELCKHVAERVVRLGVDPALRIHLNPIRFAGELLTSTFAPGVEALPIPILFYAAGSSVRATPLDEATAKAIRALADRGPCALQEWAAALGQQDGDLSELVRLAGELASGGLVAFE